MNKIIVASMAIISAVGLLCGFCLFAGAFLAIIDYGVINLWKIFGGIGISIISAAVMSVVAMIIQDWSLS